LYRVMSLLTLVPSVRYPSKRIGSTNRTRMAFHIHKNAIRVQYSANKLEKVPVVTNRAHTDAANVTSIKPTKQVDSIHPTNFGTCLMLKYSGGP